MIGIFDSGSGGLTVLAAMRTRLPSADILYFGDIKHAPYGARSRKELSELTVAAIERLIKGGATSIVSACNSVSASLAVSLLDTLAIAPGRLIEMVGPTVAAFRGSPARVALVATPATVASEIYQNAFHMIGKDITAIPIPDLAGIIEEGKSEEEIERIIREALRGVTTTNFDALVLACTHYPLVREVFTRVVDVPLFDPADAVALRVEKEWWPREVRSGKMHFMISKESAPFRALVTRFFPKDRYTVEVVE